MKIDKILSLLEGVRRTGNGWSALCPAHDDSRPSLSIREGEDGRVLLHCFAGCSAEEVCRALGLQVRDLFATHTAAPGASRDRRRCEREKRVQGYRLDLVREAERLIQTAEGIDVSGWSPARLHLELNRLADAYEILTEESHT